MPKKQRSYKDRQPQYFEGERIKYVGKAKRYCRTWFENGKQQIEWLKDSESN